MTVSFSRFIPALGVAIVLLVLAIGFGPIIRPTGVVILNVMVGLIILDCLAVADSSPAGARQLDTRYPETGPRCRRGP